MSETRLHPAAMAKPHLTLNVGISGHRPNRLGDADATAAAFRQIAAAIDAACGDVLAGSGGDAYDGAPATIRLVNALAEGADQIAATEAPAGWRSEIILPMPRDAYRTDFGDAGSAGAVAFERFLGLADTVTELPEIVASAGGAEPDRALHYRALAAFLVRQIDLLVAVWDGGPGNGPGGTAEVVQRALARGLPVIWIDVKGGAPSFVTGLAEAGGVATSVPFSAAELGARLGPCLLPPDEAPVRHGHGHGQGHAHGHGATHGADRSHDDRATSGGTRRATPLYLKASWPGALYLPFAYMVLRYLSGAGRWTWPIRYPGLAQQAESWDPLFRAMAPAQAGKLQEVLRSVLLERSLWADALGWYFGIVYRSAYVSVFILASLSVPLGLCYLFFLSSPEILDIKAGFVILELLIISAVVLIVRRGVSADWHGQWLQTRQLSELLRLGRYLAYVGAARDLLPVPAAGSPETFPQWYVRATFRELPLPDARLDAPYLQTVLAATRDTEIREQRAYHAGNGTNLNRIHHMLHTRGDFCFVLTIVFLLAYLGWWAADIGLAAVFAEPAAHGAHGGEAEEGWFHTLLEYVVKPIVSIAAAGLPALGAALTGIRGQGDFEGFAARSEASESLLGASERQIDELLARPERLTLDTATAVLMTATSVMTKDVGAWHQQFSSKRLTLPA